MEPKKFGYIDSLRGIAILLVVFVHIGYAMDYSMQYFNQGLLYFVLTGKYGVQLFFIVSAFTLTMSHYNRLDEPHKRRNFFIRRFFRIAPMFYLALIYHVFKTLDWHISNIGELSLVKVLASLTFTITLLPDTIGEYVPGGWTISVEFLFYLLIPFICSKVKSLNGSIMLVLISTLIVGIYQHFLSGWIEISYFSIFIQFPVFTLGILAYWILYDKTKKIKSGTILLGTVTILIFCFVRFPEHIMFSSAGFVLLIALSVFPYKTLSNRFIAAVGTVSYSMYFIHFIVIAVFNYLGWDQFIKVADLTSSLMNFILVYTVVSIITFLFAKITHKFIEVPGQNLGRKLIKKLNQQKQT
jgi:peptidoglycan/LPS O-acetylase OafA/YrhL